MEFLVKVSGVINKKMHNQAFKTWAEAHSDRVIAAV